MIVIIDCYGDGCYSDDDDDDSDDYDYYYNRVLFLYIIIINNNNYYYNVFKLGNDNDDKNVSLLKVDRIEVDNIISQGKYIYTSIVYRHII
jgi:hypothetical protein